MGMRHCPRWHGCAAPVRRQADCDWRRRCGPHAIAEPRHRGAAHLSPIGLALVKALRRSSPHRRSPSFGHWTGQGMPMQPAPNTQDVDPNEIGIVPENEELVGYVYKRVVREVLARIDQRL